MRITIYLFELKDWIYVGQHRVDGEDEWPVGGNGPMPDGYTGSGTFWGTLKEKHGEDDLQWLILDVVDCPYSACETEDNWIRWALDFYGSRCANKCVGGQVIVTTDQLQRRAALRAQKEEERLQQKIMKYTSGWRKSLADAKLEQPELACKAMSYRQTLKDVLQTSSKAMLDFLEYMKKHDESFATPEATLAFGESPNYDIVLKILDYVSAGVKLTNSGFQNLGFCTSKVKSLEKAIADKVSEIKGDNPVLKTA